jgi:uncharacterized damage-inducible protein DinB
MTSVAPWFARKFDFAFPREQYPNIHVRLWGTPARLEEMVRAVSRDLLIKKPGGKWSAQEHAGHLADLEPLWLARANDFLADLATLTMADMTNRKTDEANHNGRKLEEILAQFRSARIRLLDRLRELEPEPELGRRTKLHPRLKQPMRLVDHLYFVAEHDDHHLAKIWRMIEVGN